MEPTSKLQYTDADLWECEVEWLDLAGVVVPYNTDGKARCERLRLVRLIENNNQPSARMMAASSSVPGLSGRAGR